MAGLETPATPALATIAGVELGSVGYWNISNVQDWHPSADDLGAAVAALDCPAVRRPCLKFGHTGDPGEGDPAIGLIDNMRLSEDGQTLIGDFVGVPAWLAEADSEGRSVLASAYPDRSGEWQHDYVCPLGHTHPFVLHAVALLGVVRPGIGTLESLYDLYTKAPQKETTMANAAIALTAGTTIDDVRNAFYDGPGINWMLWIREMFIDPPELIIQNDDDNSLQRVSYTLGDDGSVQFGDFQTVKVEYVNARAAAEKPALAFASRAEARTTPQPPSAAQAAVEQGKETTMATLKEGLAQKLGISADADDATALAALDEALAERADDSGGEAERAEQATEPAAASAPATVTVSASVWEETVRKAEAGAQARQVQISEANERTIKDALTDGKILPKEAEEWRTALASNPEQVRKLLDGMPKNRAVATSETGHAIEPQEGVVPDDLSWFDTAETQPSTERKDS